MWHLVERFAEIKQYAVDLISDVYAPGKVINCEYQLGFGRSPLPKTMLSP